MDDFVYFLEDPEIERPFEQLLAWHATSDFMGMVDWFLGTHFQWSCYNGDVSVHPRQTAVGCAAHLVEDNAVQERNITPDATPYRSGLPINACPESDEAKDRPALLERKKQYQSVVGLIGWLALSTRPDLAPTHSCLPTTTGPPRATGTRPFTHSTIHSFHH